MNPTDGMFDALLAAARGFSHACLLHSNGAPDRHRDWLVALGARRVYSGDVSGLEAFAAAGSGWLFGYLSYDLKNVLCQPERSVGQLHSRLPDRIGFAELCWFEPEGLAVCEQGVVRFPLGGEAWFREKLGMADAGAAAAGSAGAGAAASGTAGAGAPVAPDSPAPLAVFQPAAPSPHFPASYDFTLADYTDRVERLRAHIREGDVYEVNLCPQFYAANVNLDPVAAFDSLNKRSKAPFAGYFRAEEQHLLCASPERFLQRRGNLLRSQPIKGTAARGLTAEEDALLAAGLLASEKDRAENTMIVDLVRNDLARVCEPGSVAVPELCGLHTFPTLHHLISTVEGRLRPGQGLLDVLRAAFPMGSMTGAPKIMAMELIERYEHSRRGVYSGSLGYLEPGGDMDLNVVIRSLLYHAGSGTAGWGAGGAITWDSEPAAEWNELHVKANAVQQVLTGEKATH
ncbi:MAG: aminodeoxychorismate synthase component I [Bacteroidetes bacterium]|nr:aminodeoxychorismate synthase component I [Bacteroidota bacterium]